MLNSFVDLNAGDWIAQNAGNSSVANCVMAIAKSRGYGHSILPTWKNARGRSSPSARTCENRAPAGCLGAHGAGPVPLRPPA